MSDASKEIRYDLNEKEAEKVYTTELGWTKRDFYTVDWKALDLTLDKKGEMQGGRNEKESDIKRGVKV